MKNIAVSKPVIKTERFADGWMKHTTLTISVDGKPFGKVISTLYDNDKTGIEAKVGRFFIMANGRVGAFGGTVRRYPTIEAAIDDVRKRA